MAQSSRKLLFISYFFPPSGGISSLRAMLFARFLRRSGWMVKVLTCGNKLPWRVIDESLMKLVEEIDVIKLKTNIIDGYYSKNYMFHKKILVGISSVLNLDPMHFWAKEVSRHIKSVLTNFSPDLVLITIPPFSSALLVEHIKRLSPQIPVILDFRDLFWLFLPYGSIFRKLANLVQLRLAKSIFRRITPMFDGFIVPDSSFVETVKTYSQAPIGVIPTPYDPDEFRDLPKANFTEHFTIVHAGSFHRYNNPKFLRRVFSILPDSILQNTKLLLVGNVNSRARKIFRNISWAKIIDHLPRKYALGLLVSSDANLVFVTVPASRGGKQIVPGKVFDYIGAGKPIIAFAPEGGALLKLVKENEFGAAAPIEDPEKAAKTIAELYENWRKGGKQIGSDKRKDFSVNAIIPKLSDFLGNFI